MSFFAQPTRVLLAAAELPYEVHPKSRNVFDHIREAFGLVDALNALTAVQGPVADRGHEILRHALAEKLAEGAKHTDEDALAAHLRGRAAAIASGDYMEASLHGATHNTSLEFTLNLAPSWRYIDRRLRWTAQLGVPVKDVAVDLSVIEGQVELVAIESPIPEDAFSRLPDWGYRIVDLALLAGEAAQYPTQFAFFLPEDEGGTGTRKTMVFRNYYIRRAALVSIPLYNAMFTPLNTSVDDDLEIALLTWFRAHDRAHAWFDKLCYEAGLPLRLTHVARELIADCVGFIVAAQLLDPTLVMIACMAEALRYAERDATLFADAAAARFELAILARDAEQQNVGTAWVNRVQTVLWDILGRLRDPLRFETWFSDIAARWHPPRGDSWAGASDLFAIPEGNRTRTRERLQTGDYPRCAHTAIPATVGPS